MEFNTFRLLSTKEIQKQLHSSLADPSKDYLDLMLSSFPGDEEVREVICLIAGYYKHAGLEQEWISWAKNNLDHPWLRTLANYYWLTEAGQRFIRMIFLERSGPSSPTDIINSLMENAESVPLNLRHLVNLLLRGEACPQPLALRFLDELCGAVVQTPALGLPLLTDTEPTDSESSQLESGSLEATSSVIRDFLAAAQDLDLGPFMARVADDASVKYALQIIRANRGSINAKIMKDKEAVALSRLEQFLLQDVTKKHTLKYPAMLQKLLELSQANYWQPYKTKGRSELATFKDPSGGLLTWRISGTIDAPVANVYRLLHGETNNFQFFQHHTLPELMHWRRVRKEADHEVWYYQFKMPFPLANREVLLGVFDRCDPESHKATCVRFSVDEGVPLGSKFRRATLKGSGILLEPGANPRETKMVMVIHVDPGGPIPKGLINRFLGSTMVAYIEKIDQWVRSANATRLLRRVANSRPSHSPRSSSERPGSRRAAKPKLKKLSSDIWAVPVEVDPTVDERAQKTLMQAVADGMDINGVDEAGWTPLQNACQCGYERTLDWLLTRDELLLDLPTKHGAYALSYAVRVWPVPTNQLRLVGKMLARGADPNLPTASGETALHSAALRGSVAMCRLLVEHGARPIANKRGVVPLHYAVFRNEPEMVRLFLDCGSDPNAHSESMDSPLGLARSQKLEAVVSLLEAHLLNRHDSSRQFKYAPE